MPKPSTLKAACAVRGLTYADLGMRTGYSPNVIGLVARGTVEPWPEFITRIEAALGFDPFTATSIPVGEAS